MTTHLTSPRPPAVVRRRGALAAVRAGFPIRVRPLSLVAAGALLVVVRLVDVLVLGWSR